MKIRHIGRCQYPDGGIFVTQICVVVWGEAVREVPESVRVLGNAVQEPGRLGQGLQEGAEDSAGCGYDPYVCGSGKTVFAVGSVDGRGFRQGAL